MARTCKGARGSNPSLVAVIVMARSGRPLSFLTFTRAINSSRFTSPHAWSPRRTSPHVSSQLRDGRAPCAGSIAVTSGPTATMYPVSALALASLIVDDRGPSPRDLLSGWMTHEVV